MAEVEKKDRWYIVVGAGAFLIAGIIGWQLLRSDPKRDVAMICESEQASGYKFKVEPDRVKTFIRSRLTTPAGNRLAAEMFASIDAARQKLHSAVQFYEVKSCSFLDALDDLSADKVYGADVQRACTTYEISKIEYSDDALRMKKIEDWAATKAASPKTAELVKKLAAAEPSARAELLLTEASGLNVNSCPLADKLRKAAVPEPPRARPTITPGTPEIRDGDVSAQDVTDAVKKILPALTGCYAKGIDVVRTMAGDVEAHFKVDPGGKVVGADLTRDPTKTLNAPIPEVLQCISHALKSAEFPKTNKKTSNIIVGLSLRADPEEESTDAGAPASSSDAGAHDAAAHDASR